MRDNLIRCDFCGEVIAGPHRNRHMAEQAIRLVLEDVPCAGITAKQFCRTRIDICECCLEDWVAKGFDDDAHLTNK